AFSWRDHRPLLSRRSGKSECMLRRPPFRRDEGRLDQARGEAHLRGGRRHPGPSFRSADCRALGIIAWLARWRGFRPMSRLSLFNSPLLLGFEQFERTLDRVAKSSAEGYPPYNIEQVGDGALRITLAVAGFTLDDLEVRLEDNQLVVRGRQTEDESRVFLHRGIAARQFQRGFV